jgi:uncharacterized RDD family membrane protein YckC
MNAPGAEQYVHQVLRRMPRALPASARIEADLWLHLSDLLEEERSVAAAIERMGPPDQVAAEFLAELRLTPASHGRRFLGFVIDILLVSGILLPPSLLAVPWLRGLPLDTVILLATVAVGSGMFLYYVVPEAYFDQTIGKWLVGICVVRENGMRAGLWATLIRRIPFVGNFLPIDALFVFFTTRRQRAFDKVAGTVVVECR